MLSIRGGRGHGRTDGRTDSIATAAPHYVARSKQLHELIDYMSKDMQLTVSHEHGTFLTVTFVNERASLTIPLLLLLEHSTDEILQCDTGRRNRCSDYANLTQLQSQRSYLLIFMKSLITTIGVTAGNRQSCWYNSFNGFIDLLAPSVDSVSGGLPIA